MWILFRSIQETVESQQPHEVCTWPILQQNIAWWWVWNILFWLWWLFIRSRYEKNLRRHITTGHKKGQTFSCTQCEFETTYMVNLQSHVKKTHLQEEQFSCDQCSFKTLYMRNLKTHIKGVHKTEENFECPDCNFSSAYKRSLTRHSNEIHGINKWFCEQIWYLYFFVLYI